MYKSDPISTKLNMQIIFAIVGLLYTGMPTSYAAQVKLIPSDVAYFLNESSLTLMCTVDQNVRITSVIFRRDGINNVGIFNPTLSTCSATKYLANDSSLYSTNCDQERNFTLIKQATNAENHQKKWTCTINSNAGGPCVGAENPCLSQTVTAILRVPVTTIQLMNGLGQTLTSSVNIVRGESTSIRCSTASHGSRPRALFRWYNRQGNQSPILIVDQSISPTPDTITVPGQLESDLVISYSTRALNGDASYHNMYIFCEVRDETNIGNYTQSDEVQIKIVYPPVVHLSPNISAYNVTEGTPNLVFNCTIVDANPLPQANSYSWFHKTSIKQGQISSSYTIPSVQKSDDGEYKCAARNDYGMGTSNSLYLNVQYGPILSPFGTIGIKEGDTLSVTCNQSANPPPSVVWTRSGKEISNSSLLEIPSISRLYDGDFNCTASNILYPTGQPPITKTASDILIVSVLYGPGNSSSIDPNVLVYEVEEGRTAQNIVCRATCNPSCFYKWFRNNIQLSSQGTLFLGVVLRNMTGRYVCEAYNTVQGDIRNSTVSVEVKVQYPPIITVTLTGSTQQDETSILMCEAWGVPAKITFYPWIHMWGDEVIRMGLEGKTNSTHSELTLDRLSLESMGTYVCTASNGIIGISNKLNQNGSESLHVTGKANILDDTARFVGEIGLSVNISIPFYSDPAIMSFIIQTNGRNVMNTSRTMMYLSEDIVYYKFHSKAIQLDAQKIHCVILNVTAEDFDNYTLVLMNSIGNTSYQFHLDAFGPPFVVQRFYFNRFTEDQIELHFDAGFNGGPEQTFVIQYMPETGFDSVWKNLSVGEIREKERQYRLSNGTFFVQVTALSPGSYIYRMYSWNEKGRSPFSENITVTILAVMDNAQKKNPQVEAIAGGVGAALVVIAVVIVVLILLRRGSFFKKSIAENIESELINRGRNESGLVDNPVYDSSGPTTGTVSSTAVTSDEYAVVIKPKKSDGLSKLYAQVDRTNKEGRKGTAKAREKKGKLLKVSSKGNQGNTSRGDVYENATLALKGSAENVYENPEHIAAAPISDENAYENPEDSASKGQLVNKDGLLYADLVLAPPTTKAGKHVIHGLENRTEYAQVAYGKRGEPLPESDEEKESGGGKKNNGTKLNTDE